MKNGADNKPKLPFVVGSIDLVFPFETSDAGSFISALARTLRAGSFERHFHAGRNSYKLADIELRVPKDEKFLRCRFVKVPVCGTLLPQPMTRNRSSDPLTITLNSLMVFVESRARMLAAVAQNVDDAGDSPVAMHVEIVAAGQLLQSILHVRP